MAETRTPQETHIAEEIRELEQALEAKRKALLEQGQAVPQEGKELFRETFREQYPKPAETPVSVPGGRPSESSGGGASGPSALHQNEIQALIQFAFTNGIAAAIARAKKESPWLLDELHDRLIDEYYQKLVSARVVAD